ncbi:MAG: UDP-3-O-(3-hydroxymyristoyl)glucosamine N-acyltransferase [Candidatus Omnitrophica bacterium]|nr:UDP-3-O-(3-hydroxymyristoyl)glucosamine N-acyltransferase [Candidatus Omnitrophota bacterium]MDD5671459.1 UDP-3-O-(3-hydroxymyristoyl)glucosamine N-acyltransferase [Candidatus Omnitrophota bacterium]
MNKTVQELAQIVEGKVVGDGNCVIEGITNIDMPSKGHITFAQDAKAQAKLEDSEIACLIVPTTLQSSKKVLIQVRNPKLAWAKLLRVFYPAPQFPQTIAKEACIAKTAKIGQGVTIEAFAQICEGAEIGDGSVIRGHVFIGENVKIGKLTTLHPNVVIYRDCVIGNRVILHAGTVIGADGFGYVHTETSQEKVPQVGNVIIADDVELGACVTVDRATLGATCIGKGCKIDNLVQIAHNVTVGPHTVISAQTGISGSSKIGSHVTMGGKVGVGDHVEIGDWTMVGAGAGLPTGKKIPPKQIVFGEPARPYDQARKQIAAQLRSAETLEEVKILRKKVAELEAKISGEKIDTRP